MQALILAGGRGMRLAPLTNDIPVPLLHLPGGTVLEYLLHHLAELSITDVAFVLQYGGDQIAPHVSERHRGTVHLIPQYAPFSLLGAIASAAPWVEGPTLVIHGNSFLSHPLHCFLERADPERPTFLTTGAEATSDPGVYLLPPEAFYLAARLIEYDSLAPLKEALRERRTPPATIKTERWARSINTARDLLEVNRFLLKNWHDCAHPPCAGTGYDAINFNWCAPGAEIDTESNLFFVTAAPGVQVERSRLHNALLLPGVRVTGVREQHVVLAPALRGVLRLYAPEMRERTHTR